MVAEQLADILKLERGIEDERIARALEQLDLSGLTLLVDPTADELEAIYRDGAAQAFHQIGFEGEEGITELINERALAYAQGRAAELVTGIGERMREDIRSTVTEAYEEGFSPQHLADALAEEYAFSDARAETIARTELAFADVAGNMDAYRESGVVGGKEWVLGSEHPEDDECDENVDAGVIGLDDVFPSGDDAPPLHPNCECDVLPVLMEEMEEGI